ncbi:MAG TPA: hypothetical protein VJT31_28525 [Rugosimonospora sp.]|nr:hypothetical protein [Rugosimonospora sp.]
MNPAADHVNVKVDACDAYGQFTHRAWIEVSVDVAEFDCWILVGVTVWRRPTRTWA